MLTNTPLRLPTALQQLPPLPRALNRALELLRDPNSQRSELVEVLALDPGLTGCFLRMVNSAYYGLPRRISSLDEAIGYLGYETVQSVIFATSTSKILSTAVPSYKLQPGMLWKHSVAVAAGCEWVAKERGLTPYSEAYVSGLLHDVGKLVMDLMLQHQAQWEPPATDVAGQRSWHQMEREVTGHDHAEAGAILVRSWNLPDRVVEAVACHHTPMDAQIDPRFTAALHITNALALTAGIGVGIDSVHHPLDETSLHLMEWHEEESEALTGIMQAAVHKAQEVLGIQLPSLRSNTMRAGR